MSFLDSLVSGAGSIFKQAGPVIDAFGGLEGIGQTFKVKELGWVPGARAPGGGGAAGAAGGVGLIGQAGPAAAPAVNVAGRSMASQFGDKFVEIAGKKLLERWDRVSSQPVQGVDILSLGQADDLNVAKLVTKMGVVPADSDLGQAAQEAGARVTVRNVKMSDGTVVRMRVVTFTGAKKRRRRNYNTAAGRRNAARTLRQMGQEVRTFKRLAKMGAQIDRQLNPKRSGPCVAKKTTVCRKR